MIKGPDDELPESQLSKAQALVSLHNKNQVGSCFPDRGIHAFLQQHAYKNVADFIRANNLTFNERALVVTYIQHGFRDSREQPHPRVTENPASRDTRSGVTGANPDAPFAPSVSAVTEKSARGRGGRGGRRSVNKEKEKGE